MAFIRSKKVKGYEYFYLVESVRIGRKVTQKIVKYLGKSGVAFNKTINYLTARDINELHEKILKKFGGERGLISPGTVDFAGDYLLDRKYSAKNFDENIARKGGRLTHFIISRHPFVDGNKRTGFEAMRLFLILNGFSLKYEVEDAVDFCIKISSGLISEEKVVEWLRKRMRPLRKRM